MKKRIVWIVVGVFIGISIFFAIGMKQDFNEEKIQKMEQECNDVMQYTSLTGNSKNNDLEYQGVMKSSDELNAGLDKFTDGKFDYYYDSAVDKWRKIELLSDIAFDAPAVEESTILDASDQLVRLALDDIAYSACEKMVSEASDQLSYTIDYVYNNGGEKIPAASITYLYDGTLFSATFSNLDILTDVEVFDNISEEEALTFAMAEAEAFIAQKDPEMAQYYHLKEETVTEEKFYSPYYKKHCWSCTFSYYAVENPVPFYFEILVDVQTGEIVENANNYN